MVQIPAISRGFFGGASWEEELCYGSSEAFFEGKASKQSCNCAGNRRGNFGGIDQRISREYIGQGNPVAERAAIAGGHVR